MTLAVDCHALSLPAEVDLYIVDLNPIGVAQSYFFFPGVAGDGTEIVYQGNTYYPWNIKITGVEKRGDGAQARPSVEIANIDDYVTLLCQQYQDMVGATVTRRRTLATYIAADIAGYQDNYWFIEQRTAESRETVKFDLSSPLDFLDKKLPGMIAIANTCPHQYKSILHGSGCGWPGTDPTKWFAADGSPVTGSNLDVCGKRLTDCKLRFGASNPLDYGGNPGLGRSTTA
jgi:lambda family phage minor tail protein L